jgi:TPR repeat protein
LPEAQMALGDLYAAGRGVPLDRDAARNWLEKAAAQGYAAATARLSALTGNRAPRPASGAAPLQARSGV